MYVLEMNDVTKVSNVSALIPLQMQFTSLSQYMIAHFSESIIYYIYVYVYLWRH